MKQLAQPLDVGTLDLDPENPRLPEELQGAAQSAILTYLWENDVLEELIDSYLANGFFQSEPLIALPELAHGRRLVVEGNRRLAALMILHQLPPAIEAGIAADPAVAPTPESLASLLAVPGVEAEDRADVAAYLGFRHISGLKRWDPEAKARWLYRQVEAAAGAATTNGVFYDVGRHVGSNSRGVRSAYISYGILRYARDTLRTPPRLVDFVAKERFGVWTRLLGTANVMEYLGMGSRLAATYEGVREQIESIEAPRLEEVLGDLTPPGPKQRAILGDSREVTEYSDVLANSAARDAMREFNSLSLAIEIARRAELADRLREMTRSVELLTLDVRRYEIGEPEVAAAEAFAAAARTLRGAVASAAVEEDEE